MFQRFFDALSEMKAEIEALIHAGRKLVENNAVSDPEEFSSRLDKLKALYNKVFLRNITARVFRLKY